MEDPGCSWGAESAKIRCIYFQNSEFKIFIKVVFCVPGFRGDFWEAPGRLPGGSQEILGRPWEGPGGSWGEGSA